MKIHNGLQGIEEIPNPVVAIGTFDGVHLGHQTILRKVVGAARNIVGTSVVITFHPHPRMVLHPHDHGLKLLSSPGEKNRLLASCGIEHHVVIPFDEEFSRLSPGEYVRGLIVNGVKARQVIVGYDHRFGRNREGDINTLKELAETFGFGVTEIAAEVIDEVKVSSTKIRNALLAGDVDAACRLLGYNYSLDGTVVHGKGRGSGIGFPTANIAPAYEYKLRPAHGVYVVRVRQKGSELMGVMNIGMRPTVSNTNEETLEVHVPGISGSLYGELITVEFMARIRDEMKFGSIDELREQISVDIRCAQKIYHEKAG